MRYPPIILSLLEFTKDHQLVENRDPLSGKIKTMTLYYINFEKHSGAVPLVHPLLSTLLDWVFMCTFQTLAPGNLIYLYNNNYF